MICSIISHLALIKPILVALSYDVVLVMVFGILVTPVWLKIVIHRLLAFAFIKLSLIFVLVILFFIISLI